MPASDYGITREDELERQSLEDEAQAREWQLYIETLFTVEEKRDGILYIYRFNSQGACVDTTDPAGFELVPYYLYTLADLYFMAKGMKERDATDGNALF